MIYQANKANEKLHLAMELNTILPKIINKCQAQIITLLKEILILSLLKVQALV